MLTTFLFTGDAQSLQDYRWKNRLLLIFSPDDQHPDYLAQMKILEKDSDGLKERKLRIIEATQRNRLYSAFKVQKDQFAVILLGLDGTEKLRQSDPLGLEKLFAIIDGMPMRRAELRKQKRNDH